MRAVKSKNTAFEMRVRRLLHAKGYRYRLHRKELPGCPDLVFGARKKIIFLHGCFWHGHECARGNRAPKSNAEYWSVKIARNRARDADVQARLNALGWRLLTIWECELGNDDVLQHRLYSFLGPPKDRSEDLP